MTINEIEPNIKSGIDLGNAEEDLRAGNDRARLEIAFNRFYQASGELQHKYELLKAEAAQLRIKLEEKEAEIKRSARLAMLGETAAALAHEVRNPLGSITLFTSLLKQDLNGQEGSLEIIRQIEKSLSNLDTVVSNILQFSKDHTQTLSPVNMHALINEIVCRMKLDQTKVVFETDLSGNPFITGSEHGLRQVLVNLLTNAVQATKGKGHIFVRCCDSKDGMILIEVCDDGPGIDAVIAGRLFEPFVTNKSEGTGLGLAVVKQIVVQHAGEVRAESLLQREEGRAGAKFCVSLPRTVNNGFVGKEREG